MFLPKYRLWVIVASLFVCLGTWFVIERTKLGAYLRAATENPALVQAFGINVPRMITLTYGFGVALAALAGVMAAPIYQVNPQMGANLIIVVFAVVVIGGMGSILGAIVTGFGLGIIEGLTKVFYPEASNTVIFVVMVLVLLVKPAGTVRAGALTWPVRGRARPAPTRAMARHARKHAARVATRVMTALLGARAVRRRLSGLLDEGTVLRAFRLRIQSAARLRRTPVVRPRDVPRHRRVRMRARGEGMGRRRRSSRSWLARCASTLLGVVAGALAIRRQGIYFAMITLALAQMIYFFYLQAPFTHGEDGIQAVPRGMLFGVLDLAQPLSCITSSWRSFWLPFCSSTAS